MADGRIYLLPANTDLTGFYFAVDKPFEASAQRVLVTSITGLITTESERIDVVEDEVEVLQEDTGWLNFDTSGANAGLSGIVAKVRQIGHVVCINVSFNISSLGSTTATTYNIGTMPAAIDNPTISLKASISSAIGDIARIGQMAANTNLLTVYVVGSSGESTLTSSINLTYLV